MGLISRLIALGLLLILSPLLILISLASIAFQGFPVLFSQERIGFKFQAFKLYKFRSMSLGSRGSMITDAGDSRITAWGQFLRAIKIDETPQLWNIVQGDMRFVGPRPEVAEFFSESDFSFLTTIKPGLTDFSSILFRNEAEILTKRGGVEHYPELLKLKLSLGHVYMAQKSFLLDFQLVLITLLSIISSAQASKLVKKNYMEKFAPELMGNIEEWLS